MKESTKRTVRTYVQLGLALLSALPVLIGLVPEGTAPELQIAAVLAWSGAVVKGWNVLEERGIVPAWLKDKAPSGE